MGEDTRSQDVTLRRSTSDDVDQVLALMMDVFMKEEPVNKSCLLQGLSSEEDFWKAFQEDIPSIKESPYSAVATNGSKVVAIQIAVQLTLQQYLTAELEYLPQVQRFMEVLNGKRTQPLEIPEFLFLQLLAVHKDYQKQGISGKMVDWVIERAKENGILAILSEATGTFSQKILLKRGFRCIAELKYSDYKHQQGNVILKHTDPHTSAQLLLLEL